MTSLLSDYLDEDQMAHELGVTKRTLAMWRNKRRGPAWTKLGRKVVYRRGAVAEWITSQEQKPVRQKGRSE